MFEKFIFQILYFTLGTYIIYYHLKQLTLTLLYLIYFSLVTFSRRYRAVLRACLLTFKKDDIDVYHTDEYNQVPCYHVSGH